MKYKVITTHSGFEVWEGDPRAHVQGTFALTGALVCESGIIIPWHEVRRLVPVVEPKAEEPETAPRCNEPYRLGNGGKVYCQLHKDHQTGSARHDHFARHAGSDVMW